MFSTVPSTQGDKTVIRQTRTPAGLAAIAITRDTEGARPTATQPGQPLGPRHRLSLMTWLQGSLPGAEVFLTFREGPPCLQHARKG